MLRNHLSKKTSFVGPFPPLSPTPSFKSLGRPSSTIELRKQMLQTRANKQASGEIFSSSASSDAGRRHGHLAKSDSFPRLRSSFRPSPPAIIGDLSSPCTRIRRNSCFTEHRTSPGRKNPWRGRISSRMGGRGRTIRRWDLSSSAEPAKRLISA